MTAGRGRTGGGVSTRRSKKMQAAGYPAMNAAAPAALLRSFDWKWIVIGLCVVFTIHFQSNEQTEEHTSELQSQSNLVCRLLLEKKKKKTTEILTHAYHPD